MVMTCSLMILHSVWAPDPAGIVVEQNRSVADEKKADQQPTARWIFCALVHHEYRLGEAPPQVTD